MSPQQKGLRVLTPQVPPWVSRNRATHDTAAQAAADSTGDHLAEVRCDSSDSSADSDYGYPDYDCWDGDYSSLYQ